MDFIEKNEDKDKLKFNSSNVTLLSNSLLPSESYESSEVLMWRADEVAVLEETFL